MAGGEGNDEIHTSDDHRDTVSCGPGTDRVTADVTDDVAADCETVERQFEPPWVRADGRPIGVSIDDGATYTNSLDVQVTALGPDVATGLRISSDSGFASPLSVLRNASETYPFMLASSGPEQMPKTVYVRFDGPGLDPTVTFTDDIIFDQTPPSVDSARIVGRSRGGVLIRLRASDGDVRRRDRAVCPQPKQALGERSVSGAHKPSAQAELGACRRRRRERLWLASGQPVGCRRGRGRPGTPE